jgi:hypothetical protein
MACHSTKQCLGRKLLLFVVSMLWCTDIIWLWTHGRMDVPVRLVDCLVDGRHIEQFITARSIENTDSLDTPQAILNQASNDYGDCQRYHAPTQTPTISACACVPSDIAWHIQNQAQQRCIFEGQKDEEQQLSTNGANGRVQQQAWNQATIIVGVWLL